MAVFEYNFNLNIRDINNKTELTNKAILSFFEDVGGYQSDNVGYGLKDIEKTKISWVLLHWKIQVFKKIKYGDNITVKTWSRGSKRACCFRDYEIYNKNNELCVIGTSKWALIHLENGLMRLTDELINKYQTEEKCVFDSFDFEKLPEPENYSNCFEYIVERRDIDINNHMHNICYLDLAYEALPEDVYENENFNNVEIMYKTAALLGDKLKCYYSKINNEHFVVIKSETEQLRCIIKLS